MPSPRRRTSRPRFCSTSAATSEDRVATCSRRRHVSSSCAAVICVPSATSISSFSGVATRVIARTLEYVSSPRSSAASTDGSSPSLRATRTRSRAAPGASPVRHDSHCAHDSAPDNDHPSRRSKSRSSLSRRRVNASTSAESAAMDSPSCSSSIRSRSLIAARMSPSITPISGASQRPSAPSQGLRARRTPPSAPHRGGRAPIASIALQRIDQGPRSSCHRSDVKANQRMNALCLVCSSPASSGLASAPPARGGRTGPAHPRPKGAPPAVPASGKLREATAAGLGTASIEAPPHASSWLSGGSVRDATALHREFPLMSTVEGIWSARRTPTRMLATRSRRSSGGGGGGRFFDPELKESPRVRRDAQGRKRTRDRVLWELPELLPEPALEHRLQDLGDEGRIREIDLALAAVPGPDRNAHHASIVAYPQGHDCEEETSSGKEAPAARQTRRVGQVSGARPIAILPRQHRSIPAVWRTRFGSRGGEHRGGRA